MGDVDNVQILNQRGDRVNSARLRITHQNRVLDTSTRFQVTALPLNTQDLTYPAVSIDVTPPVRCFLYDWLQYLNVLLGFEYGNVITSKEQQTPTELSFDVKPRLQSTYVELLNASWLPEYTDQPAQTGELYALINDLLRRPTPVFEPQPLVTAFRVTPNGDQRVTPSGDVRVTVVNLEGITRNIPTILPVAA